MKSFRRAICWLRRDLRLRDHAALALATAQADEVAVAFVFDRVILDALEDRDDRRVAFIRRSLEEVDAKLRRVGSGLVVLHGDPVREIPALAERLGAEAVFAARDHEPYALARDAAIPNLHLVRDTVVFDDLPDLPHREFEIAWRRRLVPERDAAYHRADKAALMPRDALPESDWRTGFAPNEPVLEPGEDAARDRLKSFVPKLARYRRDRNAPALAGDSALSVHLRFGTISIRECVRAAVAHPSPGADKWLSELVWREYYHSVLRHRSDPLPPGRGLGRPVHAQAWREGRTGYPLVDAAMRRLRADGTMHNRLRMVVASFFAHNLLLDPAEGEAWFARNLLDFDLASNRGGWRWCSEADPYPRVLNPVAQSQRYDPDGAFILRWVPEVRGLVGPALHFPPSATPLELEAAGLVLGEGYPWPVVDLVDARRRRDRRDERL